MPTLYCTGILPIVYDKWYYHRQGIQRAAYRCRNFGERHPRVEASQMPYSYQVAGPGIEPGTS